MSYATQADIAALYGEELLYIIADRDRDQVLDFAAIESALSFATGEIESALMLRYADVLPLAAPSADIKRICIDLAVYRLAQGGDTWTKEIRERYDDARTDLRAMAEGRRGIGIAPATTSATAEVRGGDILVSTSGRMFTRQSMRGL